MSDTTKTQLIGFHAEPELADGVREAASREERSVSEYMRRTLRRQLEIEARIYEENHNTRGETAAVS